MKLVPLGLAAALLVAFCACASLQNAISPPSLAKSSPEPVTPLALPAVAMKGARGDADAQYPADYGATVKPDGTILFPQHTQGHVTGSTITVGHDTVLTVADDGTLKGVALKHHYHFEDDGSLVDEQGHGVRIDADGAVHAVGGAWRYKSVLAWTPDGAAWDHHAWRTLEVVALIVVENMLPAALGAGDAGAPASDGGGKGLDIHIPPPSQWFK